MIMKNIFNINDKDIEGSDYISKNFILRKVSEEEIFKLVFKFKPKQGEYCTSPFREDDNPGCWFDYDLEGRLVFTDFGSKIYNNGRKVISVDCFDAVRLYYNFHSFFKVLEFVKSKCIDGKNLPDRIITPAKKSLKEEVEILVTPRKLTLYDKQYWFDRYGITKNMLIHDKVFPIKSFSMLNTKKGDITKVCNTLTYCYSGFKGGRKKLYMPFSKGKKFLTNCLKEDIGGVVDYSKENLLITKSYKDYRVLKNKGVNVIWFQNEGMYPDLSVLLPICSKFRFICILFDNDVAGIFAADNLKNIINSYLPNKAWTCTVPRIKGITDPSDLLYTLGDSSLIEFLVRNKII